MASPIFRLSTGPSAVGAWTPGAWDTAIDSAKELFIRVDLQSSAGVSALAVSIPSADPVTLAEGVPAVTVNQASLTGVFQLPHAVGPDNTFRSLNVQVTINQGLTNNIADASLTRSLQVNVLSSGGMRALVVGESDEYHRSYGHTQKLNAMIQGSESGAAAMNLYDLWWSPAARGKQLALPRQTADHAVGRQLIFTRVCKVLGVRFYHDFSTYPRTIRARFWDPSAASVANVDLIVASAGTGLAVATFGTPYTILAADIYKPHTISIWDTAAAAPGEYFGNGGGVPDEPYTPFQIGPSVASYNASNQCGYYALAGDTIPNQSSFTPYAVEPVLAAP